MRDLAGTRVLVTGAAGFIGANLVRALLTGGAHVTGLVRPGGAMWRLAEVEDELDLLDADALVPGALDEAVARARPELAVHLAFTGGHPTSPSERLEQLEVSVLGTARLVEALATAGCSRLVHVGSSLEYGPKSERMREDDLLAPVVPRGAAKAAATLVCLAWSRAVGIPAVVLRSFAVYGPWEDESRLVPTALRASLAGKDLPLTEAGIARDFVYVGDVVDAILRGLTAPATAAGQVVNIGSGVQTTIEELVATVGRVVGRDVRTLTGAYATQPHDASTWAADVERAREVLDWAPSIGLEEGLRRTLSWLDARAPAVSS